MDTHDWVGAAIEAADKHPTIKALLAQACELEQHTATKGEAHSIRKTAEFIKMSMVASAGLKAGEFKATCTGFSHQRGRYIQVQSDQGWDPDPFWSEISPEEEAIEGSL